MEITLPIAVGASAFVGLVGLFFGWLAGHARNNNCTQALMNKIEAQKYEIAKLKAELKDSGEFFNHEIAVLNKELDRRQHIIDAYTIGESSVSRLIKLAESLIDEHPFLYVELSRLRITGWMVWLRKKPKGELIVNTQGCTAEEACENAMIEFHKVKEDAANS